MDVIDRPTAGLGLKPEHADAACAARAPGLWFEVHAENHMVDGGPRLAWVEAVRSHHPLSLHGVGLSLAGSEPPDATHLARLARLVRRLEPVLVSEHLAWSSLGGTALPDLLPFVRDHAALARLVRHVDQVQDTLGCRVALENPSHYLRLDGHDWSETDFLAELSRRTGCGLLLDLNNVFVSAANLGLDAHGYLRDFPVQAVMEVHLAGHSRDPAMGEALLIDSHDAPVAEGVWALLARLAMRMGPRALPPLLIERDGNLPAFDVLLAERQQALDVAEGTHTLSARP